MRFAILDGNKIEASKGVKGFCQSCGAEMIAKCGEFKINHWAHKNIRQCDSWWETETEWHREWKGHFPIDWQEIIQFDSSTNEKHIADVRTDTGLIIEFQHSHIDPKERTFREKFYKNMVWVVDGTRLKRDYPRFLKGKKNSFENIIFYETENPKIFRVDFLDWCFPIAWLESSVPVIFDFRGDGSIYDSEGLRNTLYCLFPQVGNTARVAEISRKAFIKATINGEWILRVQKFINDFKKQDEIERIEQLKRISHTSNKVTYSWRGIPLIGGYKAYRKHLSGAYNPNRKRRQ